MDAAYGYLGGRALGRDKNGKPTKDNSELSSELAAAGVGEGSEYSPFVLYEFEII